MITSRPQTHPNAGETTMAAKTKSDPQAPVTTLATRSGRGAYDFAYEHRLVERGGKHYLLLDLWSGGVSIEGECYRHHLYIVPAGMLDAVRKAFEHTGRVINNYGTTEWEYFVERVVPELQELGRAEKYWWARSL